MSHSRSKSTPTAKASMGAVAAAESVKMRSNWPFAQKVRRAVELVQEADPDLVIDGEMQADTALNPDLIEEYFPFSKLRSQANLLIFPNLEAANLSYKLLAGLAGAQAIGPILLGMGGPVGVLQKGVDVQDIVNMAAITVLDAQDANHDSVAIPRKTDG